MFTVFLIMMMVIPWSILIILISALYRVWPAVMRLKRANQMLLSWNAMNMKKQCRCALTAPCTTCQVLLCLDPQGKPLEKRKEPRMITQHELIGIMEAQAKGDKNTVAHSGQPSEPCKNCKRLTVTADGYCSNDCQQIDETKTEIARLKKEMGFTLVDTDGVAKEGNA